MRLGVFLVLLISCSWISARSVEKSPPGFAECNDPDRNPDQHLVANPESCHSFFYCVEQPDGTFGATMEHCPAGLGFDFGKQRCEDPEMVASCSSTPVTCQDGWEYFHGSCYYFTRDKVSSFAGALQTCSDMKGYLVEVNSKLENDFLVNKVESMMMGENDGRDYWMGGDDIDNDGVWRWSSSGEEFGYSNFWSDQGKNKGRCLQLIKNGRVVPNPLETFFWGHAASNADCSGDGDGDNGIICEAAPSPSPCEDGWRFFAGHCYLFSRDSDLTFAEALETCQAKDAYLVEINTEAEDKFIVSVVESMVTGPDDGLDYWMGGQDNDGVWEWATSGEPFGYSNFWSDQGGLTGGCTQLLRKGRTNPRVLDTFYWARAASNKDCTNKDSDNGYICEKRA